ncbi:unnamed protein product [Danaus chrysippus]|uniref:(African queen) hypothetical protein n=1 Tax=Danaus chrysippus TaxID=151541 RepID=A0A8J2W041_9NEOP|nr:unnamed protein product [Danaus chrysippus]
MAIYKLILICSIFCAISFAQRGSYAGKRPIGYPELESNPITNKYGETADLPIEANGDWNLIKRLSKLPDDKKPFWFLNWRQYNEVRNNPKTYQQRPNVYIEGHKK